MTQEEFQKFKDSFEKDYKNIGQIKCPYFNEDITFNAKGLEHLKFLRKNHARITDEQIIRIRLFPLVPEILKLTRTIQGITHTKHFEVVRTNQRNEIIALPVVYYEFIAIIKDKRVRVIIKQIYNGPKFFWSVIPFWKVDKNSGRRRMSYGNPETD